VGREKMIDETTRIVLVLYVLSPMLLFMGIEGLILLMEKVLSNKKRGVGEV